MWKLSCSSPWNPVSYISRSGKRLKPSCVFPDYYLCFWYKIRFMKTSVVHQLFSCYICWLASYQLLVLKEQALLTAVMVLPSSRTSSLGLTLRDDCGVCRHCCQNSSNVKAHWLNLIWGLADVRAMKKKICYVNWYLVCCLNLSHHWWKWWKTKQRKPSSNVLWSQLLAEQWS